MGKKYRANVAAILQRRDGRILIARRSDYPDSWQFPQGGVDRDESPLAALQREVEEEVALPPHAYRIAARRAGYRYEFPGGPDRRGYDGQEQVYFLCCLEDGAEKMIRPENGCGEFTEAEWVEPGSFPYHLLPSMKAEVYRGVMRDFFGAKGESR